MTPEPPSDPGNPRVTIETSKGTIRCELFERQAPTTVANFLAYAREGFYDGLIFHRVIRDFVVQGGGIEPSGRRRRSKRDPIPLEIHQDLVHWDGALAMARTNDPDSATSQFYITHGAQHGLDDATLRQRGQRGYAVFGIVEEGKDVVASIARVATDGADRPRDDVLIESVTVHDD